ncbi:efflux RND transporter permease subunit [Romboutsia sp.]|uniref:efflux RND transporter permease subunit n=1 Tax=Romboutsia sp. TaxID=1965302 RepID=UPI003F379F35
MKLTSFSIKRPVTIFMAIITVLMFGVVSFFKLNVDMLPSFNLPMLMVMTQYHGAGPEEIESLVTEPFEGILLTTSNVENINSVSSEGSSMIMLEFQDGTDMDFASIEVREKIDMVKGMLPSGASSPTIIKMNPNMMPIMNLGISMEGKDISNLSTWANNVLTPALKRVDGVATVDLMGASSDEVRIVLNPDKLASFGINSAQLINLIRSENLNTPGGTIKEGDLNILVRASNQFKSIEDIENIFIPTQSGDVVKLKDVADVKLAPKGKASFSKINGKDSLILSVQKESTANTVKLSKAINNELNKLKKSNKDLEITPIFDQAEFINLSLNAVKTNAIIGAILAILVLLFFLKDLKTTLIMAISIPISVIATFVSIYFANMTLNMISLGGMALGIGMLVDNSIVVIENISRLKKLGLSSTDAAIQGTKEVASAITASTLTTICVFLPIVFVEGIAATIFKEMALTVTFALVCSLLVAFTLVPLLASRLITDESFNKENKFVNKLKVKYTNVLEWALMNKLLVGGILVLSIILGGVSLTATGIEFFPTSDQGIVYVDAILPKGTNSQVVNDTGEYVIKKVGKIKDVETTTLSVSESSSTASIMLVLKDSKERDNSDVEIANLVRKKVKDIPGVDIKVNSSGGMMSTGQSAPISITISGHELKTLEKISNKVVEKVSTVKGAIDVKVANEKNAQEIKVVVDKEKAAKYGVTSQMVSQVINQNLQSSTVSSFTVEGKTYDVSIYSDDTSNPTLYNLENINIITQTGQKVPLSQIASLERGEGYHSINRTNQNRSMTISANINGRSLGEVVNDMKEELKDYKLPNGYSISFGGEVAQMNEAFSSLLLALILSIALVYMVMAAQFESLLSPFIIMFTVPLAFVGALLALFIFDIPVSIPAMIGFVVLTGIIVNNGIVLVDLINRLKSEGKSTVDAILIAGPTRLQPILMTTLTTVLGLLPMALGIGEGAELQLPLAVTVTGGLIFSTVLTLVVVPVVYYTFDRIKTKMISK